jgi:hypothetical protein
MGSKGQTREVRAGRNQSLFRAVNESLVALNEAFAVMTDTFSIACECADVRCIETLEISPEAYAAVRADPRRFVVLTGHVYPDVERVVDEADDYVVVEKFGVEGSVAEMFAPVDGRD